jgi:urease accessory protein
MLDTTTSLQPRAKGGVMVSSKQRDGRSVIDGLHQSGCLRTLFPRGGTALDAVLINTSGGVTGGDNIEVAATVGPQSAMVLTTQAAERAYRAQPDQTGRISTEVCVQSGGTLHWLPQEIILFDGCDLSRTLDVDLASDAKALIVEPVVFGRTAMGETLTDAAFRDRISINCDGKPIYRDGVQMSGNIAAQLACASIGQGMSAMASVIYAAPDAEAHLKDVRSHMPASGGASILSGGLLVARLMAPDSYLLRRSLIPIIERLSGAVVPKTWRL